MNGVVLVCGIPTESPVALVLDALADRGTPFVVFNQRAFADTVLRVELAEGEVGGELRCGRTLVALDQVVGVYTRLMDDRQLPEWQALEEGSPTRRHGRLLHDALLQWIEMTPARVVNRTASMASNSSKPYQAQIITQHGFRIPDTLVTNDPDEVRAFAARHGRVIYKSASGIRSIVRLLTDADLSRLDRIRWCPTQFQAHCAGVDVRVHVVGDEVFATRIATDGVDYRYANREGGLTTLHAMDLQPDVAARCIALTRTLGLAFGGVDLRRTPEGEWVCFEVNPSPGFSFYESSTGQPISQAVAAYLAGGA